MTVTIVRAVQTCTAAPSQWDAWDSEGRYWYLRYRGGHGSAEQYPQGPGWYEEDVLEDPAQALSFDFGHPLDGFIGLKDFARLAGLALELAEYRDWGRYAADELGLAMEALPAPAAEEYDPAAYLTSPADEALEETGDDTARPGA